MTELAHFRIILSKRVARDIERIFAHIAKDSPQNAPAYIERVLTAIEGLKIFPHRNVVAGQGPRKKPVIRSLTVESHVIFFRVLDKQRAVQISQIRHGARKRPKRFR